MAIWVSITPLNFLLFVFIFGLTKIANAKTVSVQSTSLRNPRQLMVLFPDHQTNTRNAKQFRDANCLCANSQSTRNLPSRILRPLLNKQLSDMQARTHNSEGDGLSHEQEQNGMVMTRQFLGGSALTGAILPQRQATCSSCPKCPAPLPAASITSCGSGSDTVVSAAPRGTIYFTTKVVANDNPTVCTYVIVASAPNTKIVASCPGNSQYFASQTITKYTGGSATPIGALPETTSGNVAVLNFVFPRSTTGGFTISCSWVAMP